MKKVLSILFLILIGLSCKKNQTTFDMGYGYYPLNSKHTLIYDVVYIQHDKDLIPQHDTSKYQIKITVGDEDLIDELGDDYRKLFRYTRLDSAHNWAVKDVWTVKQLPTKLEVVEENQRMVKLIFAPTIDKEWDKNALNSLDETASYYEFVNKPYQVSSFTFNSTIKAVHQNFKSFVDYRLEYGVYAKNVGEVYSVHKDLVIDNFDTLDIKKGTEFFYTLIDYSN